MALATSADKLNRRWIKSMDEYLLSTLNNERFYSSIEYVCTHHPPPPTPTPTPPQPPTPVSYFHMFKSFGCLLQVPWCGTRILSMLSAIGCRSPQSMCWAAFCAVQAVFHCLGARLLRILMWLVCMPPCQQKPNTTFNMIKVNIEQIYRLLCRLRFLQTTM